MFRGLGLNLKSTLPETAIGLLGGVVAYKYGVKKWLHRDSDDLNVNSTEILKNVSIIEPTTLSESKDDDDRFVAGKITARILNTNDDLDDIGTGKVVILMARGYPGRVSEKAKHQFYEVINKYQEESAASKLKYYIIDDSSAQIPAAMVMSRLGLTNENPFIVILEDFKAKEKKYLMDIRKNLSSHDMLTFITRFCKNELKPSIMGQERPPNDRNPNCRELYEVVTESFDEIVLDPKVTVLFEGYTRTCTACKALAPRFRMLAQLMSQYQPDVRVAAMDVLDNDRDISWLPEKSTPSIRLFPAVGETHPLVNGRKQTIPMDIDSDNSENNRSKKVFLPTIPEILDFMKKNKVIPAEAPVDLAALAAENEALVLERLYAQTLEYVQLYRVLVDEIQEVKELANKVGSKGKLLKPQEALLGLEKRSSEMQKLVMDSYEFLVTKAAIGSSEEAFEHVEKISSFVDRNFVSRILEDNAMIELQTLELQKGKVGKDQKSS